MSADSAIIPLIAMLIARERTWERFVVTAVFPPKNNGFASSLASFTTT